MIRPTRRRRRDDPNLFLYEELMLLALRDEEGTVISSSTVLYPLAGALLAEMMMGGRLAVADAKRRTAKVVDRTPFGDPLLDEALGLVTAAKRTKSLQEWVFKFARIRKLKQRVIEGLIERGIVRADEASVLLLFKQKVYPQIDPAPERAIVERLRRAIFRGTRTLDERTVILVSLAKVGGLLSHLFDKQDLKERKERIKNIVSGELSGKAAGEAAQAAQTAIMAAIIATSAASTAARSSH